MVERTPAEKFVVTFARAVVAELSPGELMVFDPVARAFLRDPRGVLNDRLRPGAPVGPGIGTAVVVLTPVALAVATGVWEQLTGGPGDLTIREIGHRAKGLRKRLEPAPAGAVSARIREATVAAAYRLIEGHTGDPALARRCAEVVRNLLGLT